MSHDPLTCTKCSPEPWASTEVTALGWRRRFTGWAAFAVMFGPFILVAFALGVAVGLVIA
jgi:hypothetical protein